MRISDWSSYVCSSDLFVLPDRDDGKIDLDRGCQHLARIVHGLGDAGDVVLDIPEIGLEFLADQLLVEADQLVADVADGRSEERRVGKECVRTWRSRWSPLH